MIHKTSIISIGAKISNNVEIGPYSVIGPNVLIGKDTKIHSHVSIMGNTANIGAGILLDAFARKGLQGGPEINSEPHIEYEDNPEEIDILGVGATPHTRKMLKDMDIPLVEQGVLRNMTGVLLGEGRRRGLDILAILVEADPRFPDARAAAELITHLNTLLPAADLDGAPLIKEAERLESQLKAMMDTHLSGSGDDQGSDGSASMLYG